MPKKASSAQLAALVAARAPARTVGPRAIGTPPLRHAANTGRRASCQGPTHLSLDMSQSKTPTFDWDRVWATPIAATPTTCRPTCAISGRNPLGFSQSVPLVGFGHDTRPSHLCVTQGEYTLDDLSRGRDMFDNSAGSHEGVASPKKRKQGAGASGPATTWAPWGPNRPLPYTITCGGSENYHWDGTRDFTPLEYATLQGSSELMLKSFPWWHIRDP
ncbi:hypothetical protein QBC46DRAFT_403400 [Diplogelasinospora grovesii]|uniref:Uncharacterized protein n=1 Tax=Diplogelasinospora grovesii TaxID=303347 RepID=A0AAN6S9S2_9PEZI|nr:hypothetical protein QBC46DRAFT_403400 [Diplogelasinospora grovesii]